MSTIEITPDNLKSTIDAGGVVLLDFWAQWCGPCHSFSPVYERISQDYPDVVFGTVDTDAQQLIAAGFGIRSIPTIVAVRGGIRVFSRAGVLNGRDLAAVVDSVIALEPDEPRH